MVPLKIRLATILDRDFVFELVNSDYVRAMSFSKHKITYAEHCRWFDNLLHSDAFFFVGVVEDAPVGYVRFQTLPGIDGSVLSVAIADGWRGRKLGSLLVNMCCCEAFSLGIDKIVAIVKAENVPSIRLFKRCCFCLQEETLYEGCEVLLFCKNKDVEMWE